MKTIRAFIAITLPEAVRRQLGVACQSLAAQLPPRAVRWVQPALIHLTLRFLGEVEVGKVVALAAALDRVAANTPAFTMRLGELGCFPNSRRPRVIWVSLEDSGPAVVLQRALEQDLVAGGWPPEDKPFHPHLTLGRVKGEAGQVGRLPWGQALEPLPVPVEAIHLIESQLRPSGPIYTKRHTSHLCLPGNS